MRALVIAVLMLLVPLQEVAADHPWAAFFGGSQDVTTLDGGQSVALPGDIVVTRRRSGDGSWSYSGFDRSGVGAAGCLAMILIEIGALHRVCPDLLTNREGRVLDDLLSRAAGFYDRNAVPPITAQAFMRTLEDDSRPKTCPDLDPDTKTFVQSVLADEPNGDAGRVFDIDRLPVVNPCL